MGPTRKAIVLSCLLRSVIVLLASFTIYGVACLFEARVWMADLESTRRTAFLKAVGLSFKNVANCKPRYCFYNKKITVLTGLFFDKI
jgi:hypothetical protein